MAKSKLNMHDLRVAAMDGDYGAARTLLKLNGHKALAAAIRRGKPIPPPVRRHLDALTAGTNTEWEKFLPDGRVVNDLQGD